MYIYSLKLTTMQHLYTKTKYKSRKVFNNSLTKNLINCIFPVATKSVAKLICAKENLPCLHYEIQKSENAFINNVIICYDFMYTFRDSFVFHSVGVMWILYVNGLFIKNAL